MPSLLTVPPNSKELYFYVYLPLAFFGFGLSVSSSSLVSSMSCEILASLRLLVVDRKVSLRNEKQKVKMENSFLCDFFLK